MTFDLAQAVLSSLDKRMPPGFLLGLKLKGRSAETCSEARSTLNRVIGVKRALDLANGSGNVRAYSLKNGNSNVVVKLPSIRFKQQLLNFPTPLAKYLVDYYRGI